MQLNASPILYDYELLASLHCLYMDVKGLKTTKLKTKEALMQCIVVNCVVLIYLYNLYFL